MGARVNENIKAIGDLGQVFLPRGVRKKYGLKPGALVMVVDTKDGILLKPIHDRGSMVCIRCSFFDFNDPSHGYGVCEPQDEGFHVEHECNLSKHEIKGLESLTGHGR